MKKNILVTIPLLDSHKERLSALLAGKDDYELYFCSPGEVTDELLSQAEIVMGNLPSSSLAKAPLLKWVQLSSAGADVYTKEGALAENVLLTNSAGAYGTSVSEHMLAVTFALIRRLPKYGRNQVEHIWNIEGRVTSIEGATIAILGLGDIGGSYAKKVKALGATTIGVRRTLPEKPDYLDEQVTLEDLDTVLPRADIVAMVLPGGPATAGLMDERRLRLMKKGSFLINDGRGNAIDAAALKKVLKEGHLGGVALDVTDPEPLPADDELWDFENVLITPHIAGQFLLAKTLDQVANICAENLSLYLEGKPLTHQVSRKFGY